MNKRNLAVYVSARRLASLVITALLLLNIVVPLPQLAAADEEDINLTLSEIPPKGSPKLDTTLDRIASGIGETSDGFLPSGYEGASGNKNVRVIIESIDGQAGETLDAVAGFGNIESSYGDLLQAVVPASRLTALSELPNVHFVRVPNNPLPAVTSEGVALINADDWKAASYNGTGVKIGILDVGFSGYTIRQSEGELSSDINTWWAPSINGTGTSIHGTACAEIVFDIAPGASYYLANFDTEVEFGNAVEWLVDQNVDIISCSVGWPAGGPGDGTGVLCQIVDFAEDAGVLWVQAAGNQAQRHWQGSFTNANTNQYHDFAPGDEGNSIYVSSGNAIVASLNWDDTWGASANDYDLLLFNNSGQIVALSANIQDGDDDPYEGLSYTANYTGYYRIAIGALGTPESVNFHLYSYYHDLQYQTASSSLLVPADSFSAVAVGAVGYNTPDTLKTFSSHGPTDDGRIKPDLVAPDGVSTASYGATAFSGTSASAPHTAGAAALVKQLFSAYTPGEIQAFLEGRVVDLGGVGKDNASGSGRLDLGSAYFTLTMVVSGSGSVTPAAGSHVFVERSTVNITAASSPYWEFIAWTGDVSTIADIHSNHTTIVMDSAKTITANFSNLSWSQETDVPSTSHAINQIVPGCEVIDFALNGSTVYAVTGNTGFRFYKSIDGGITWDGIPLLETITSVTLVAVAPDDEDLLAVVTNDSDQVWLSTNGGYTFSQLTGHGLTTINDLAISAASAGEHNIAIAGEDATGAGLSYFNLGATVPAWTDASAWASMDGTSAVRAIAFSPNFPSDKAMVAVTSANTTKVLLEIASFISQKWNNDAGFTEYNGTRNIIATGTAIAPLQSASISLPPDYLAADAASRKSFVGLATNAADATIFGGVYRMNDESGTLISGAVRIHSVSFDGTNLVAGAFSNNNVYRSDDPLVSSPTVDSANTLQRPGGANMVVVSWADSNVVAGTSGNESAFAVSSDNGTTFNDVSLIDTHPTNLNDVAVSPDGNKKYLVSNDGADTSVWRKTTAWERVLTLSASTGYIVLISPESEDVVWLLKTADTVLYYSNDAGETKWQLRALTNAAIDLAVESDRIAYALRSNGSVFKTADGGFIWGPARATGLGNGATIVSLGENWVLVGGSDGGVAWSTDGNASSATWIAKTGVFPGGVVQVTGSGLTDGGFIYAATGEPGSNVMRWQIGTSTTWADIISGTSSGSATGLLLENDVLYALTSDSAGSYLLWTSSASAADQNNAWTSVYSAGVDFDRVPQALKISETSLDLWAIDNNTTDRLFRFHTQFVLTIGINGSGTVIPGVGQHSYQAGTVIDLSASPATGWRFVNWTGDVSTISNVNSATTTIIMNDDYTITANFSNAATLTMGINGSGTVIPDVGDHVYPVGATANITATPDSGWQFSSWTGDVASATSSTTTVTMNFDKGVTANFSQIPTPPGSGGGGGGGGGGLQTSPPGVTFISNYVGTSGVFIMNIKAKSADYKVWLTIPKGTKGKDRFSEPLYQISILEVARPPAPPADSSIITLAYDIKPNDANFEPSISLTFTYYQEDIPEGINEEDLSIAVWNDVTGKWEFLDSLVDAEGNEITAIIAHFSTYAVITESPPAPAAFTIKEISISPAEIDAGQTMTVSVIVTNTGELSGSYLINLRMDGTLIETEEVTLAGGTSRTVVFTATADTPGKKLAEVGGLIGSFIVKGEEAPPTQIPLPLEEPAISPEEQEPAPISGINWWILGGATLGCAILATLAIYFIRRRKQGTSNST